jgi:thiol:disulfide interchange protein DsbD
VLFAASLFLGTILKREQVIPAGVSGKAGYEQTGTDTAAVTGVFRMATYKQVQKAIASGQPAVLDFYADWCKYCKKLDKETFSDPRVVAALEEFQTLKIDIEKEPRLEREYGILGVPTIVFIGPDGKEMEPLRQSGFRDAAQFLQILEQVKMRKEANDGTID